VTRDGERVGREGAGRNRSEREGGVADRLARPPVALFSQDARAGGAGKITEAELRDAYWVKWCGRLDEFCEVVGQTHLGVVVGERRWEATVVEAVVSSVAAASDSGDSDGPPALVLVVDGDGAEEGEEEEGDERSSPSRPPVLCEWLDLWQVPGSLLPTTTTAFIGNVLDRCQRVVLRDRELATRSPLLRQALIRVLEKTEDPVVEVQALARALPSEEPGTVRSLQRAWARREGASELGLKELLCIVLLLRALLGHVEWPELSWSEVALAFWVTPQTLRRYLKRYAGVTLAGLEPVEIPALVSELERRVVEALR